MKTNVKEEKKKRKIYKTKNVHRQGFLLWALRPPYIATILLRSQTLCTISQ